MLFGVPSVRLGLALKPIRDVVRTRARAHKATLTPITPSQIYNKKLIYNFNSVDLFWTTTKNVDMKSSKRRARASYTF